MKLYRLLGAVVVLPLAWYFWVRGPSLGHEMYVAFFRGHPSGWERWQAWSYRLMSILLAALAVYLLISSIG